MTDGAMPPSVKPFVDAESVEPVALARSATSDGSVEADEPTKADVPAKADPPAGGRIPTEIRLVIWKDHFTVTTLAYHTISPSTYRFAHPPPLLATPFRSEALPYYLPRLHDDLAHEAARYRSTMKARPADECAEATYQFWLQSLSKMEINILGLKKEIEAVEVELHGMKVVTKKSLFKSVAKLDVSA